MGGKYDGAVGLPCTGKYDQKSGEEPELGVDMLTLRRWGSLLHRITGGLSKASKQTSIRRRGISGRSKVKGRSVFH